MANDYLGARVLAHEGDRRFPRLVGSAERFAVDRPEGRVGGVEAVTSATVGFALAHNHADRDVFYLYDVCI